MPAPRQVCPLCADDHLVRSVPVGPDIWEYTCGGAKNHPNGQPGTWTGTPEGKLDGSDAGGVSAELGLYDDLPACLVPGEPYVEYGVVEHRYS